MRALMGLIKDRLQVAVACVLGNGKPKQVYLKRSLGTTDIKAANIRAKLVLAGFDRIIGETAVLAEQPSIPPQARSGLNETEIRLMADHAYATALAWDDPRDMPVWGDRYAVHAAEPFAGSPYDQDAFIRGCVLILVDLRRVQPRFRR